MAEFKEDFPKRCFECGKPINHKGKLCDSCRAIKYPSIYNNGKTEKDVKEFRKNTKYLADEHKERVCVKTLVTAAQIVLMDMGLNSLNFTRDGVEITLRRVR